ncbi:hypothetical protein, partial [Roseisolibacter sp. H3M3-2]|uniref:hypothetical protein n=1 Tax=Roseisolibacter sp. H3M3-2 TaxID=3031323 RepID=UPI0023DB8C1A
MILPALALLLAVQPPARPRQTPVRPAASRAAAPAPDGTILVGAAGAERQVLLVEERQAGRLGRWVRADQLAGAAGGSLVEDGVGRWRLRLPGVVLAVREGIPFLVAGEGETTEVPLLAAPQVEGERLWVPFQLVSDVLPRLSSSLTYDPTRRALTLTRGRPTPPRTRTGSPPTAPTAR